MLGPELLASRIGLALHSAPPPSEPIAMEKILEQLRSISAQLSQICDGVASGRMAWPEAEAGLRRACSAAEELERDLEARVASAPPPLT
jgi:hypothetical protein